MKLCAFIDDFFLERLECCVIIELLIFVDWDLDALKFLHEELLDLQPIWDFLPVYILEEVDDEAEQPIWRCILAVKFYWCNNPNFDLSLQDDIEILTLFSIIEDSLTHH